ncbi:hypothetical protein VCHA37P191_20322 [Vibrio chagasii]|nr:hypothetical protein VCHA37P191_20322 [Vibrio chagasii]
MTMPNYNGVVTLCYVIQRKQIKNLRSHHAWMAPRLRVNTD